MFDHYRVLTPKPSQCHISNSIYPNLGKIDGRVETRLNKDRPEKKWNFVTKIVLTYFKKKLF